MLKDEIIRIERVLKLEKYIKISSLNLIKYKLIIQFNKKALY